MLIAKQSTLIIVLAGVVLIPKIVLGKEVHHLKLTI